MKTIAYERYSSFTVQWHVLLYMVVSTYDFTF